MPVDMSIVPHPHVHGAPSWAPWTFAAFLKLIFKEHPT